MPTATETRVEAVFVISATGEVTAATAPTAAAGLGTTTSAHEQGASAVTLTDVDLIPKRELG